MILPQKQWQEENRASHGLYLDTSSPKWELLSSCSLAIGNVFCFSELRFDVYGRKHYCSLKTA